MPTYEYKCLKCDHHFEFFQSMSSDRLTDCPLEECDGSVKRMIGTGAGIIFKGSGFYETDYRSEKYKAAAKADTTASKSSDSVKGDKKKSADSKPAKASTTTKSESSSPSKPKPKSD